jgi:hypothetical protein
MYLLTLTHNSPDVLKILCVILVIAKSQCQFKLENPLYRYPLDLASSRIA